MLASSGVEIWLSPLESNFLKTSSRSLPAGRLVEGEEGEEGEAALDLELRRWRRRERMIPIGSGSRGAKVVGEEVGKGLYKGAWGTADEAG